jgi:CRP-like cAMP-binding protein
MAASLHRFRTRADRLAAEQTKEVRKQLSLALPDLSGEVADVVSRAVAALDAKIASENGWTFVMLSPADNAKVVAWLSENSSQPKVAMRLWSVLFLHLRRDTGEIAQTRDELAEAVAVKPGEVSRVMGELESIGAVLRKREKVAGLRGPGVVRYFMNPRIGTHLPGKVRDKAQAEAPLLRLVEKNAVR